MASSSSSTTSSSHHSETRTSSSSNRRQKKVPMSMGDFSVMDDEFANVRERFDQEMKRMEDEMNKFRGELLERESGFFDNKTKRITSPFSSHSMSSSKTETSRSVTENGKKVVDEKSSYSSSSEKQSGEHKSDLMSGSSGLGDHSNWLHGLESPLIKETDHKGQKELKLRFDVSEYAPEEIMVKTVDNKLLVHARHEEKAAGKSVFREYNREFLLPSGTDPEAIRSSLSRDGVLTVEAPLPQPAITQEKRK